tara:strand:- start:26 stop:430 length:405 start_codon:yes stop_codon:yes gene_type:complete
MLSSESIGKKQKFLLDENVNNILLKFLNSLKIDANYKPKGLSNGKLAEFFKIDKKVLITNDNDFNDPIIYSKDDIYSIILLKVPQNKPESLITSFKKFPKENSIKNFEGKLITLYEDEFDVESLATKYEYGVVD